MPFSARGLRMVSCTSGRNVSNSLLRVRNLLFQLEIGGRLQIAETPDPRGRRESRPCPGGARWARRYPASRARCAPAFRGDRKSSVRMLCRRSASFTRTTRTSRDHRQQHLPDALHLAGFRRDQLQAADLGDAFDQARDVRAELFADRRDRNARVFDDVVQQRGAQRGDVQPQIGQDVRDFQGMGKVGLAGLARLLAGGARRQNQRRAAAGSDLRPGGSGGRFPAARRIAPAGCGQPSAVLPAATGSGRLPGLSTVFHGLRIVGPRGNRAPAKSENMRASGCGCFCSNYRQSSSLQKQRRPGGAPGRPERTVHE